MYTRCKTPHGSISKLHQIKELSGLSNSESTSINLLRNQADQEPTEKRSHKTDRLKKKNETQPEEQNVQQTSTTKLAHINQQKDLTPNKPMNQELFLANCLVLQLIGSTPWAQKIDKKIMASLAIQEDQNKYHAIKTTAKLWLACKLTQVQEYCYRYITVLVNNKIILANNTLAIVG